MPRFLVARVVNQGCIDFGFFHVLEINFVYKLVFKRLKEVLLKIETDRQCLDGPVQDDV